MLIEMRVMMILTPKYYTSKFGKKKLKRTAPNAICNNRNKNTLALSTSFLYIALT